MKNRKLKVKEARLAVELGRGLRQRETETEDILWEYLRERKLNGAKFRRQHPIKDTWYIVDFYCHEARLVVEIDGEIHKQQVQADKEREEYLIALGYQILRFTNEQVLSQLEKVLATIASILP